MHNYIRDDYYTVKKDGIIKFSGKWGELETVILNEAIQTQEDKGCTFFSVVDVSIESPDLYFICNNYRGQKFLRGQEKGLSKEEQYNAVV